MNRDPHSGNRAPDGSAVRTLRPEAVRSSRKEKEPGRGRAWVRFASPAAAGAVLLVLLVGGTGTISVERPIPDRVEAPPLSLPDEITMSWEKSELADARIVGLTRDRDRPMAVASVGDGAPVLVDPTSGEIVTLDAPSAGAKNRFTVLIETGRAVAIVAWDGGRVQAWRDPATTAERHVAELHTQTGLEDLEQVTGAAGNGNVDLLLGMDAAGRMSAWIEDGVERWRRNTVRGLEDAELDAVVASDGVFLAGGARCEADGCSPAIWWSADGITWRAASSLGSVPGSVTGIASSGPTLYAVGVVEPGAGTSWRSDDGGRTWSEESTRGLRESVAVTVAEIEETTTPRTALLRVNGEAIVVNEGGLLTTPLGDVSIGRLEDAAVLLHGGETHVVAEGATWTLHSEIEPRDVDVLGDRLVVVGLRTRPGHDPEPVVWVRNVRSRDWRAGPLPGSMSPTDVTAGTARIVVAGEDDGDAVIWTGTPSLLGAEREALAAVDDFLAAVTIADHSVLRDLVAARRNERDTLTLPGLSGIPLRPWHRTGAVDEALLIDVAEFVAGLDTSIATSGCDADAAFGELRTVRVVCDYRTTSSLLRLLGIARSEGTLIAMTRDAQITSMTTTAPDETKAWSQLGVFVAAYASSLAGLEPSEIDALKARRPTADTATAVLEAGAALDRLAFHPGETRATSSPLGGLEVSWLVEPFGPSATSVTGLTWTGTGFLAATLHEEGGLSTRVWASADGRTWEQRAAPRSATRIDGLVASADGIVAWGGTGDRVRMWRHDGDSWRELPSPVPAASRVWIIDSTTDHHHALIVLGTWEPATREVRASGLYVRADGLTRLVDLPESEIRQGIALTAGAEGFVLAMQDDTRARLWKTSAGESWSLLADLPANTFGWLIDLARQGDRYLALAEARSARSCAPADGECRPPREVWASPDGRSWERLAAAPSAASAEVVDISAGELGLVSPVRYGRAFLLLWMSSQARDWAVPSEILPVVAPSQWWFAEVTIGDTSFVVDMTQSGHREPTTVSLIVARLVGR